MISVVMPVINRASELAAAVESVQRQTDHDWELLIVDDGSTDGSLEVARGFQNADSRIRSLIHPHRMNLGPGASRNLGVAAARGEFVAFLDSDDLLEMGALATYKESFEKFPEVAVVYGKARVSGVRDDGSCLGFGIPGRPADLFHQLVHNNAIATGATAVRRNAMGHHPFPPEMPNSQDWACWLKLSVGHPFLFVDEYLLRLITTDESISGVGMADSQSRSRYVRIQTGFLRRLIATIPVEKKSTVTEGLRWRSAECLLRAIFSCRRGRLAESVWWAYTWLSVARSPQEVIASSRVAAQTLASFRRGVTPRNHVHAWK